MGHKYRELECFPQAKTPRTDKVLSVHLIRQLICRVFNKGSIHNISLRPVHLQHRAQQMERIWLNRPGACLEEHPHRISKGHKANDANTVALEGFRRN